MYKEVEKWIDETFPQTPLSPVESKTIIDIVEKEALELYVHLVTLAGILTARAVALQSPPKKRKELFGEIYRPTGGEFDGAILNDLVIGEFILNKYSEVAGPKSLPDPDDSNFNFLENLQRIISVDYDPPLSSPENLTDMILIHIAYDRVVSREWRLNMVFLWRLSLSAAKLLRDVMGLIAITQVVEDPNVQKRSLSRSKWISMGMAGSSGKIGQRRETAIRVFDSLSDENRSLFNRKPGRGKPGFYRAFIIKANQMKNTGKISWGKDKEGKDRNPPDSRTLNGWIKDYLAEKESDSEYDFSI